MRVHLPNFVADPNQALEILTNELDWVQRDQVPRQEYYSNDTLIPYTYGAGRGVRTYNPQPWHPLVLEIREELETFLKDSSHTLQASMDVCFLNRYENERNSLGWHADDSPEMDPARPIVTVSLGAERDILFRPKPSHEKTKSVTETLRLKHGSAAIMLPGMQQNWQHRIPKASFKCGPRISLTFRGFRDLSK
jgi:alkylated DNA repair dioxygenase AlkB